ncbi:MAG: hypothetical protein IPL22_04905 [Bacteroidetes bacterium]|nr:hypothetical protein [Bacteroidota bacterium]
MSFAFLELPDDFSNGATPISKRIGERFQGSEFICEMAIKFQLVIGPTPLMDWIKADPSYSYPHLI